MLHRLCRTVLVAFLQIIVVLTLQNFVAAQKAILIDEIERPRCDLSEVPQLDNLSIILNQDAEAKGLIVLYGVKGRIKPYTRGIYNYLKYGRNIESNRVSIIYGGYEDSFRMQIWAIPKGAQEPQIKYIEADNTKATRFENYFYFIPEIAFGGCATYREWVFSRLINEIKDDESLSIYLIVHPDKKTKADVSQDWELSIAQAERQAKKDKSYLSKKFKIKRTRIIAAAGNLNESAYSEIWIVPKGAEPPKP